MRTQLVIIAILVFLTPKISFGQVNPAYNNRNYTVVPIDLRYFSGENKNNQVLISWALASQPANVIELQKSFNARDFISIASFMDAVPPQTSTYSFLDTSPFKNENNLIFKTVYYRLKQIDANHIFDYSKIIEVREMNEIGLVYSAQTPISYQFTPKGVTPTQSFSIVNVAGQVMMNGQVRDTDALDIRRLPAGFYCLNIQSLKIKFLKN
jgi:hypothetical protein